VKHPRRGQRVLDVVGYFNHARFDNRAACNQDNPEVRIIPFVRDGSGGFPEEPFGAVSFDRIPDLPAGHHTYAQAIAIGIIMIKDNRAPAYDLSAAAVTNAELPALLERHQGKSPLSGAGAAGQKTPARKPAYTARRLRPFLRRRFRTSRPALVRIRDRKPWTRLRFWFFGWNVRFITCNSLFRRKLTNPDPAGSVACCERRPYKQWWEITLTERGANREFIRTSVPRQAPNNPQDIHRLWRTNRMRVRGLRRSCE